MASINSMVDAQWVQLVAKDGRRFSAQISLFTAPLYKNVEATRLALESRIAQVDKKVDVNDATIKTELERVENSSISRDTMLSKDIKEINDNLAFKTTFYKPFETLAKLNAWVETADEKKTDFIGLVWNDVTVVNNKLYGWDGTKWSPVLTENSFDLKTIRDAVLRKGENYPLVSVGTRNSIEPKELSNRPFYRDVLLNVTVINARPGYYYRLSWYGNGSNEESTTVKDYRWQFEEVKISDWSQNGDRRRVLDVVFQPPYGKGVQTLTLTNKPDRSVTFLVTIDTDAALAAEGLSLALWSPNHTGYTYIIDPANYVYRDYAQLPDDVPDNAPGDKYTGIWSEPPELDFYRQVNGGYKDFLDRSLMMNTLGNMFFQFPGGQTTSFRAIAFSKSFWHHEIPLVGIRAFTTQSAMDLDLFGVVRVNHSGVTRFSFRGDNPLYVILQGTIVVLRRLPKTDKYPAEDPSQYMATLAMDTIVNGSAQDVRDRQYIGGVGAYAQSAPFLLTTKEFVGQTPEHEKVQNDGYWVRQIVPVCQPVLFENGGTYAFSVRFNRVTGQDPEPSNMGLKIESGNLTANFDAGPYLSRNYSHRMKTTKGIEL